MVLAKEQKDYCQSMSSGLTKASGISLTRGGAVLRCSHAKTIRRDRSTGAGGDCRGLVLRRVKEPKAAPVVTPAPGTPATTTPRRRNELELYRPGMSQFITIPSSRLTAGTYKKMSESDMLPDTLQIDLSGDLLVAHVFSYKYSEDAERMYDQQITPRYKFYELVSENTRTFNIANLQ
jgi:hypothetical protein